MISRAAFLYSLSPRVLQGSPHELRSPRRMKAERGCVEDQPQRVGSSRASGDSGVLRLVEDDTAALRYQAGIAHCSINETVVSGLLPLAAPSSPLNSHHSTFAR